MNKVTVIFNNIEGDKRLKTGWGSSMLIEQDKELILFDVGPDAEKLRFNLHVLGIDKNNIHKIAISHRHRDHRGAMDEILRENPRINVYRAGRKKEIASRVYLRTVKGFFAEENVLVIDSARGLILLTGCAHPGIYRISRTIKKDFGKNIYAVLGGFHLEYHPPFLVKILGYLLRRLGIEIIGPNHCTGERATGVLQQVFKEGFLDFASGKTFEY